MQLRQLFDQRSVVRHRGFTNRYERSVACNNRKRQFDAIGIIP